MLKAIAAKNRKHASTILKKIILKRNIAVFLTLAFLASAIRNFEKWTTVLPVEWNGLKFFAFLFSLLAVIASAIHLVQQFRRVNTLKAFIRTFD